MDTADKRASAIGIALAFRLVLPVPDASVGASDRPHVAYCYAGLTAAAPIPATADVVILVRADVGTILVRPDVGTILVRPDVGEVDV